MYERQYTARHYAALFLLLLLLQDIDKGLSQGPQMFELTEDTFGQFTKDKDVMLVEFIMPWCKHCQALQPEWEKAAQVLASNREYILGKVNCWESGKSLCDKLKIPMYPEIRLYRHGVFIESYDGERNAGALLDYAQRAQATTGLVGPAAPLPPPPPPAPPAPPPAYPSIAIPPSPEYPPPDASLEPTISSAGSPPPTESKSMQQPAIQPPLPPAPYPSAAPPKLTPALPKVEAKQDLDVYQSLIPPPPMAQTYQPPPVQSFIQKESRPGEQANQNQYNVEQPGTEQQSFAAPISQQQQQQQQQQRPPSAYTMTPAVNNGNTPFWNNYNSASQKLQAQQSYQSQYLQQQRKQNFRAFPQQVSIFQPQANIAQVQRGVQLQLPSDFETKLQNAEAKYISSNPANRFNTFNPYANPGAPSTQWNLPSQNFGNSVQSNRPIRPLPGKQPSIWNYVKENKRNHRYPNVQAYSQPPPVPTNRFSSFFNQIPNLQNFMNNERDSLTQWSHQNQNVNPGSILMNWGPNVQPSIEETPSSFQFVKTYDMSPYIPITGPVVKQHLSSNIPNPLGFYKPRPIFHQLKTLDDYNKLNQESTAVARTNPQAYTFDNTPGYLSSNLYNNLLQRRKEWENRQPKRPYARGHLFVPNTKLTHKLANRKATMNRKKIQPKFHQNLYSPYKNRRPFYNSPSHAVPISKQRAIQIEKIRAARTKQRARLRFQRQRQQLRQRNNRFGGMRALNFMNRHPVFYNVPTRKHYSKPSPMMTDLIPEQPQTDQALIRNKVPSATQNQQDFYARRLEEIQKATYPYRQMQMVERYNQINPPFVSLRNRARLAEQMAWRSRQNAAKVHQANMAHFFAPHNARDRPRILQTPLADISAKRAETEKRKTEPQLKNPKPLIGFWDKLYKYYSKKEREFREGTTPKSVEKILTKDDARKSNMKELDLVENFLENKFERPTNVPRKIMSFVKAESKAVGPTNRQSIQKEAFLSNPTVQHEIKTLINPGNSPQTSNSRDSFQLVETSELGQIFRNKHLNEKNSNQESIQSKLMKLNGSPQEARDGDEETSSQLYSIPNTNKNIAEPEIKDSVDDDGSRHVQLTSAVPFTKDTSRQSEIDYNQEENNPKGEERTISESIREKVMEPTLATVTDVAPTSEQKDMRLPKDLPSVSVTAKPNYNEPTIGDERTTSKPGHATESTQENAADAILHDAQAEASETLKSAQKRKENSTAHVPSQFVLKDISRNPEPWDKRAKVTFKLSKKSGIPEKPVEVVGVFGSLKKKKRRKKRKRKRSHDDLEYSHWIKHQPIRYSKTIETKWIENT